jgi:dynamin 1-like protein
MINLLTNCLQPTNQMVKNLVIIHESYINTNHPDFMGGANSLFDVFDPSAYQGDNAIALKKVRSKKEPDDFDKAHMEEMVDKHYHDGIIHHTNTFSKHDTESTLNNAPDNGRVKDFNEYEINKYMQKEHKAIHLPQAPKSMRAQNSDPGQNSPRSTLEVNIIKNLIMSYFDTVTKNLNDIVPKTIMAFLVNKTMS